MMKAMTALIRRELLEHKGAFLWAPAILLGGVFLAALIGLMAGDTRVRLAPEGLTEGSRIYEMGLAGAFFMWSGYLLIALFFYYADSFSADRRNNALLFWKSMPQSDLKILASKALAGITLFPALIFGFAVLTGVFVYALGLVAALKLPFIEVPGPGPAVVSLVQMSGVGALYVLLSILWYAPFLAWVAGLSTLFQRWSIPLAVLIPGAVVLLEFLTSLGKPTPSRPIARYLAERIQGVAHVEDADLFQRMFETQGSVAWQLLIDIVTRVDWLQMAIGLGVAVLIVYLASEYRRRRIEA